MAGPRRGILLGLGFSLEALKAAGVTDAQLDAPAHAQLTTDGGVGTGIYDVEFDMRREQIDVTTYSDTQRVYLPGLQRASVRFKVPLAAVQAWRQAIFSGQPVEFNEQVGPVRVSCLVAVTEVVDSASLEGGYVCTVRAQVVGAPTITHLTADPTVQPGRTVTATLPPPKKDRGRRAIKLDGSLID